MNKLKKITLSNGVRFIYEKRKGGISSFCIGFEAGALMEGRQGSISTRQTQDERANHFKYGTAHAVEHMLYKGTITRSEDEINVISDEIFGFSNAMTNYPYAIYYGTTLSSDLDKGLELYSDILLNPSFPEKGFNEELKVIIEELRDWQEDPSQYCEDMTLKNAFSNSRIKERIIGTVDTINGLTLHELKSFYKIFYLPSNCVITVVTSLEFNDAYSLVDKYFGLSWREDNPFIANNITEKINENYFYEENTHGVFYHNIDDASGVRIQYLFPIHNLNKREGKLLKLFNVYFGDSITSILYDEIRTKRGLVYDIKSKVADEKGIKLFSISLSTRKENADQVIKLVNEIIDDIKVGNKYSLSSKKVENIINLLRIRRELLLEKSIQLAKELTCYELMFNSTEEVYNEFLDITERQLDENISMDNQKDNPQKDNPQNDKENLFAQHGQNSQSYKSNLDIQDIRSGQTNQDNHEFKDIIGEIDIIVAKVLNNPTIQVLGQASHRTSR